MSSFSLNFPLAFYKGFHEWIVLKMSEEASTSWVLYLQTPSGVPLTTRFALYAVSVLSL